MLQQNNNDKQSEKLQNYINNIYQKQNLSNYYKKTIENSKVYAGWLLSELYHRDKYRQDNYILVPHYPSAYSKNNLKNPIPSNNCSLKSVKLAIKILEENNMIHKSKGFAFFRYNCFNKQTNKIEWEKLKSKLTSIHLKNIQTWNINKTYFEKLCTVMPKYKKQNIAVYKIKNKENKIISYPVHDEEILKPLQKINDYFINNNHPELRYQRIFGKDANSFGRFYNSFQSIKKEERKKIYIENGWCEIDFSSFTPNLFYILAVGKKYEGDVYNDILNYLKLPLQYRSIFKQCFNAILSSDSKEKSYKSIQKILIDNGIYNPINDIHEHSKLKRIQKEYHGFHKKSFIKFCKNNNLNEKEFIHYAVSPDIVIKAVEKIHSPICAYFYKNNSSFTQNIESSIIQDIMLLQVSYNLLPLTIHDCIIIPIEYKELFNSIMEYYLFYECLKYINKKNNIKDDIIYNIYKKLSQLKIDINKIIEIYKYNKDIGIQKIENLFNRETIRGFLMEWVGMLKPPD